MTSKAQYLAGYPVPEDPETEETQSFCIVIPAGDEYRAAAYAQLLMLGKWWKWKREESQVGAKLSAETWRQLFEFNEDCGGFLMSPEEFYDANKRSIYDAWNDIAKQIVSGRVTGFVVGEDGTVTTPSTDPDAEVPDDDPETPIDESLASRAGGAIAVRSGINQLLADIAAYYGVDATADMPYADGHFLLSSKYVVEEPAFGDAVSSYWIARAAAASTIASIDAAGLDAKLYCKGITKQSVNQMILSLAATNDAKRLAINLVNGLSDTQFALWFEAGSQVPSTNFESYSCTKIDTEEFDVLFPTSNVGQFTPSGVYKGYHRYLFEWSGTTSDPDVPNIIQDAYYRINTSTGARVFSHPNINIGGITAKSQADIPYEPSHNYAVTYDKNSASNGGIVGKTLDLFAGSNIIGSYHVKITDLGEYIL